VKNLGPITTAHIIMHSQSAQILANITIAATLSLIGLTTASSAQAVQVKFEPVLDSNTLIPGQNKKFESFSVPSLRSGNVVFQGSDTIPSFRNDYLVDPNKTTIYELQNGKVIAVPSPGAAIPSGKPEDVVSKFGQFINSTPGSNGSLVVFATRDNVGSVPQGKQTVTGLYRVTNGTPRTIARNGWAAPKGERFTNFGCLSSDTSGCNRGFAFNSFDVNGNSVAFGATTTTAQNTQNRGVFLWKNGVEIKSIADEKTPIPGGTGSFIFSDLQGSPVSVSGDRVLFRNITATNQGQTIQNGVYLRDNGKLSVLANQNTNAPNSDRKFSQFGALAIGGDTILIAGKYEKPTTNGVDTTSGLYQFSNGTLNPIQTRMVSATFGQTFRQDISFESICVADGLIAYVLVDSSASRSSQRIERSLYVKYKNSSPQLVVGKDTTGPDGPISNFDVGKDYCSSNQLVISVNIPTSKVYKITLSD
jgi:hypothetical protein